MAREQHLVDRLAAAERRLGRRTAAFAEMRQRLHALGNAVQIVDLGSRELVKRMPDEPSGLLLDVRNAGLDAHREITALLHLMLAKPEPGAPFAPTIRNALDLVRASLPIEVDVKDELLASTVACRLDAEELELVTIATLLEARSAKALELVLRERTIEGKPWFELIRCTDLELAPSALLAMLVGIGEGEVTSSHGREGFELAIALPRQSLQTP
ncbi:MAG TPA: hypothetical protein VGC41_22510 [Kofleriaceae bacterium]